MNQALAELQMVWAADPGRADTYFEAAKVVGEQVLTVSQELPAFCMLPALQCVTASCYYCCVSAATQAAAPTVLHIVTVHLA